MYTELNVFLNLLSAQFCVHNNKLQQSAPPKVTLQSGCSISVPVTGHEETVIGGGELK